MTMTRKYYKGFLSLYLIVFLVSAISLLAHGDTGISSDEAAREKIIESVLNQHVRIMPQLNNLNFGFGRLGETEYLFTKTTSKIFFQQKPVMAEVTKIQFENGGISLQLENPRLGSGTIAFNFSDQFYKQAKVEDVSAVLLKTLGDENLQYVFINPGERIYHLFTCNHLNPQQKSTKMTLPEVTRQGYDACGFCFKKVIYLPEIEVELMIEREWWSRIQGFQSLMDCSERQMELQQLGERLLDNWPFSLLGYDYTFNLANSPQVSAFAIPSGKIVVTTAILDSLESEEELEALLLLAIAHVEKRHSLKQYLVQRAEAEGYQRLLNFAGTAGSIAGIFAGGVWGTVGSAAIPDAQEKPRPVLGFQEDLEKEADLLAALYFDIQHKDKRHLVSLLKKLQFNEMAEIRQSEKLGLMRLAFEKRIKQVEEAAFLYFGKEKSFVIHPKNGFPSQLKLLYQRMVNKDNKLDVYISDIHILHPSESANRKKEITLSIKDKNGNHEFKNQEQYNTQDLWGVYLTFEALNDDEKHRFLEDVETIVLKVSDQAADRKRDTGPAVLYYKFVAGELANEDPK